MTTRRTLSVAVTLLVLLGCGTLALAQTATPPTLVAAPESFAPGIPPPLRLSAPAGTSGIDLSMTTRVLVAGTPVEPLSKTTSAIVINPPDLNLTGDVPIHVQGPAGDIGIASVHYRIEGSNANARPGLLITVIVYVLVLAGFISVVILYDIKKAYEAQAAAQVKLFDHLSVGSISDGQLTTLVDQLQQGPPGVSGLGRTTIAFAILIIIGIAIFHIVANCQSCDAEKLPPVVDRTITLLAGALTSITGFYFGTRAAQGDAGSDDMQKNTATTSAVSPSALAVSPAQAKAGQNVVITGSGFGQEMGNVLFGPVAADKSGMAWNDNRITVTVPQDARLGPAPILITRFDGHQVSISPTAFTVVGS